MVVKLSPGFCLERLLTSPTHLEARLNLFSSSKPECLFKTKHEPSFIQQSNFTFKNGIFGSNVQRRVDLMCSVRDRQHKVVEV